MSTRSRDRKRERRWYRRITIRAIGVLVRSFKDNPPKIAPWGQQPR